MKKKKKKIFIKVSLKNGGHIYVEIFYPRPIKR